MKHKSNKKTSHHSTQNHQTKKSCIFAPMNQDMLKEEVAKTVQILKDGGIILYPTDTVWGIGCDAENTEAVYRINEIKGNRAGKSFIVLIHNEQLLHKYSSDFNPVCYDILDAAESPTTIVYPNAQNLAKGVAAEDGSIGMRMTQHPFSKKVLEQLKRGLVSTSANISGEKTDGNFESIPEEIKEKVDYIVEIERETKKNIQPSSVIKIGINGEVEILRK